jgi:replication initiator protein
VVRLAELIPREKLTGSLRRDSVKKNVAAIHVSGKLTLLQRKLSNVLLLNAYDDIISKRTHSIDAQTLCLMIGYNSNDIDTLKQALRGLAETVAEWDMLDEKGRQEWGVSSLLSYAKMKEGVCEYAYSPALAEKLHDPKVFALINLNIQRRFTSGHALALYENCFRFVRTGSTGWWPLELFRRLMGVDESAYYETFKHLNAKIIKPAVTEINKTSNIIVTPDFRRKGRSVTDVRFLIKENPQLAMFDIDDSEGTRKGAVYKRLLALGASDRLARQWISEHGEEYVQQKMDYVSAQDGITSPVKYLSAAIRNDYEKAQKAEVSPETQAKFIKIRNDQNVLEELENNRKYEIDAERRKRAAIMVRVQDLVAERTPTQRDSDKRLFLSVLKDDLDREDFARLGWNSALNARAIEAFWSDLMPGSFDDIAEL